MSEHQIHTVTLKPQPTAAIHVVCHPSRIADAMWEMLPVVGGYLEGVGVSPVGGPYARYFDETEDEVDFEGGFILPEPVPGSDEITAAELPGGLAATTTHVGPLEEIAAVHDAIGEWVLAHGHDPAGPVWEVYVVGPAVERDPSRFHTDIVWPLRK